MASGKKRNLLNLSIPPSVNEEDQGGAGNGAVVHSRGPSDEESAPKKPVDSLDNELKSLTLSQPQVDRLNDWISQKAQIGELNEDLLERISDLGHGNGGVVHKMRHKKSNMILARKLVRLEVKPSIRNQILKELEVLHKCNSPYIVGFYGAFTQNTDISICMEYMDGLSLDIVQQIVGRLEEKHAGRIAISVIRGLAYLKDQFNILHRDIKPSNMLVNSQGDVKLCDFGVSCMLIDSMANSFVGTRSYMAPERLTGARYSILSDVWSVGLTLVELVIGRYPIPAPSKYEYARIFGISPAEIRLGNEIDGAISVIGEKSAEPDEQTRTLSIFELLECIVNKPPPVLPLPCFTPAFVEFTTNMLKKVPTERWNLAALMQSAFYQWHSENDDQKGFAQWLQSIKRQS